MTSDYYVQWRIQRRVLRFQTPLKPELERFVFITQLKYLHTKERTHHASGLQEILKCVLKKFVKDT